MTRFLLVAWCLDGSTVRGSEAPPSFRSPHSHPLSRREP